MKLFQKTSVAVALTVVMIAAAIGIGQVRGSSAPAVPQAAGLDKSLSTSSLRHLDQRRGRGAL